MTDTGVTWAEGVQACTAIAAYIAAPATVQFIWKRVRYRFRAKVLPIDVERTNSPQRWQIVLKNGTRKVRKLRLTISTRSSKSKVIFADIVPKDDSGVRISSAKLEGGCFRLQVKGVNPERHLVVNLILDQADEPTVYSDQDDLTFRIDWRRSLHKASLAEVLSIAKLRLMTLLIYFVLGAFLIVAALIKSGL